MVCAGSQEHLLFHVEFKITSCTMKSHKRRRDGASLVKPTTITMKVDLHERLRLKAWNEVIGSSPTCDRVHIGRQSSYGCRV